MPYIRTTVSNTISDDARDSLKKKLGEAIALIPGKSEAWLMLAFEDSSLLFNSVCHQITSFSNTLTFANFY